MKRGKHQRSATKKAIQQSRISTQRVGQRSVVDGHWRRIAGALGLVLASAAIGALIFALLWSHRISHVSAASQPTSTTVPTGLVRFSDTQSGTSFAVQTDVTDPNAGVFNFAIPSGAQYHGGQASDLQQTDVGKFTVHYDGAAQLIGPASEGQEATITTVTVHLNAEIDITESHATAEIKDDTNKQHFVMVTQVPTNALQVVQAFNQAWIIRTGQPSMRSLPRSL